MQFLSVLFFVYLCTVILFCFCVFTQTHCIDYCNFPTFLCAFSREHLHGRNWAANVIFWNFSIIVFFYRSMYEKITVFLMLKHTWKTEIWKTGKSNTSKIIVFYERKCKGNFNYIIFLACIRMGTHAVYIVIGECYVHRSSWVWPRTLQCYIMLWSLTATL